MGVAMATPFSWRRHFEASDPMPAYDPDNIFAKIIRGELPCHRVFEDPATLVFMDIMPRGDGHTLVLPKRPSRNLLDIDLEDLSSLMAMVQRVAIAAKAAFKADGVTLNQFSESAGGQVVFHTHVHVIPRFSGVALRPHTGDVADDSFLADHARKIAAAL